MPLTYHGENYDDDDMRRWTLPFHGFGYQIHLVDDEFGDVFNAPHHTPDLPPGTLSLTALKDMLNNASRRLNGTSKYYQHIHVELFFWDIDEDAKAASRILSNTFRKYGYVVTENELRSRLCSQYRTGPIDRVFAAAADKNENRHEDTLVIMHYIGGAKQKLEIDNSIHNFHVTYVATLIPESQHC
jgi:hypothetical protein